MPLVLRMIMASVWLGMGLGAKVLGLVPRHREIVARILGEAHADVITVMIGVSEIGMAVWILSGIRCRLCGMIQIGLVVVMNLLEVVLARDLLLFGAGNLLVAVGFVAFVWFAMSKCPGKQEVAG